MTCLPSRPTTGRGLIRHAVLLALGRGKVIRARARRASREVRHASHSSARKVCQLQGSLRRLAGSHAAAINWQAMRDVGEAFIPLQVESKGLEHVSILVKKTRIERFVRVVHSLIQCS